MKYITTVESDDPFMCDECGTEFETGDTYFELPKPHHVYCEDCMMQFEKMVGDETRTITTEKI